MKGTVYAYGPPCPRCGQEWESVRDPVTGDVINILCKSCYTLPTRFAIDGRPFKNRKGCVKRVFRDFQDRLFYYFQGAYQFLSVIRADWHRDPVAFEPSKYNRSGRARHKLSDVWASWQAEIERTRSRSYSVHVGIFGKKHVLPAIGGIDVRELTREDVSKLDAALEGKGLSPQSRRTALDMLYTALRYARDNKLLSVDDIPPRPRVKVPRRKRYWIGPEEQAAVRDRMPEGTRLLLDVLFETGMRPGEGVALKRVDILPERRIHIQRALDPWRNEGPPKNGYDRKVDISEGLYQRLVAIPCLPEGYLFRTEEGLPYTTNALSKMFRVQADALGLHQVTLYTSVRHSTATRVKQDAEERAIREAAAKIGNTPEIARIHYVQ